jgi:predicted phosphodiesterase
MFCVTADRPETWKDARIYTLSDLHLGDGNCDLHAINDRISAIRDDPRGLVVLNGDIMNVATRHSISDIYSENVSPMQAITRVVGLFSPIRDRIIAANTGNHEARVYKQDGIDIMRLVCRELGCEAAYNPEGVLVFLRFGSKPKHEISGGRTHSPWTYVIYATHGTGGGRKEGGKAIRLADMASIVDADIYIHSHTHLPMAMKESYFRTDIQNQKSVRVDKLFVNDGSTVRYGGYGQTFEYKPLSMTSPVINLRGDRKHMSVTL